MSNKLRTKPLKSNDIPATKAHLELVRNELKSDITSLSLKMESGFKTQDSRFQEIESRFTDIDARFGQVDARFTSIDARFEQIDARFKSIDARFEQIDARFAKIDARFDEIDSKFEKLFSIIYEMKALFEEQNSRNRVVLDGYAHLFDRSIISEARIENLEKKVFGIVQK